MRGPGRLEPRLINCTLEVRYARSSFGPTAESYPHGLVVDDMSRVFWAGQDQDPPPSPIELPGDTVAQEALGYLHANCGNCHNRRSGDFPMVHLELHLETGALSSVEATTTYRTTMDVPFEGVPPSPDIAELRIAPGDPEGSAVYQRMNVRGPLVQMPPLATEEPDATGLAAVATFISGLGR